MRVLEVLNDFPGETFLQAHIHAISTNSTEIELILSYTHTKNNGRIADFRGKNYMSYALPNFNHLSIASKILLAIRSLQFDTGRLQKMQVKKMVSKISPEIIHFQFASTALKWCGLLNDLNIPYTFSIRGADVQVLPYLNDNYRLKLIELANNCRSIHAVCDDIKEEFLQLTRIESKKVKIIRTTIDKKWYNLKPKSNSNQIVSIGRLHWRKSFADLIVAIRYLIDSEVECTLKIVGDGPEKEKLEYIIRDLGLQEFVELSGYKSHDEISEYISNSELIVLSSVQEGFPNVLAQAMASGLAIVSTNCNGVKEILKDGYNAWLAEPGDPIRLSAKIKHALTHKQKAEEFANVNKSMAQEIFSQEKHAKEFIDFWKN